MLNLKDMTPKNNIKIFYYPIWTVEDRDIE